MTYHVYTQKHLSFLGLPRGAERWSKLIQASNDMTVWEVHRRSPNDITDSREVIRDQNISSKQV